MTRAPAFGALVHATATVEPWVCRTRVEFAPEFTRGRRLPRRAVPHPGDYRHADWPGTTLPGSDNRAPQMLHDGVLLRWRRMPADSRGVVVSARPVTRSDGWFHEGRLVPTNRVRLVQVALRAGARPQLALAHPDDLTSTGRRRTPAPAAEPVDPRQTAIPLTELVASNWTHHDCPWCGARPSVCAGLQNRTGRTCCSTCSHPRRIETNA